MRAIVNFFLGRLFFSRPYSRKHHPHLPLSFAVLARFPIRSNLPRQVIARVIQPRSSCGRIGHRENIVDGCCIVEHPDCRMKSRMNRGLVG